MNPDQFNEKITKTKIILLAKKLVTRVFPEYSNVEDSCPMIIDDETQTEPQELTFAQKLQVRLDEAKKNPSNHSKTISIEQEFKKFAQNSEFRPQILEKLYNALLGIPIFSVEAERCFFTTGNFSTKLQSNLSDETLSALVYLKHNSFFMVFSLFAFQIYTN